jgi:hypothetical protein
MMTAGTAAISKSIASVVISLLIHRFLSPL